MTAVAVERDLRDVLPHRYPMLLVDRVLEIVPRRTVRAVKAVTRAEPWLTDGDALPAVLLIESWCQSAGLLATWDDPNPDVRAGQVMLFASITDIRLGDPVGPGSLVVHEAEVVRDFGDTLVFAGRATCDGRTVLEVGSITVAFRPAGVLQPSA